MLSIKPRLNKLSNYLPDKPYLYLLYLRHKHKVLNLKNPQTFGDYIHWMKLYGNLERYSDYADKYAVRGYVETKIGEQYLVPMLGVWDNFLDIPFDLLPNRFVLKASHGCGYNLICKDKAELDKEAAKNKFDNWLKEDFYHQEREPQYKHATRRIIAEKYLEDDTGQLTDYKFYCTKGEVKLVQVNTDRFSQAMVDELYDVNWNYCQTVQSSTYANPSKRRKKPSQFKKMVEVARILSEDFPFVRVDLYEVNGQIYFGELTFTPGSGLVSFAPKATGEREFARLLEIDLNAYA